MIDRAPMRAPRAGRASRPCSTPPRAMPSLRFSISFRAPSPVAAVREDAALLLSLAVRRRGAANRNTTRLGLLELRNLDGQHAVGEVGRELLFVEMIGQGERPRKRAVGSPEEQLLLGARGLELARAFDRQNAVLEGDVD